MADRSRTLRIAPRFCGPRNVGNGGYVAGLLGRLIDGPIEVTLRRPPPLERSLRLEWDSGAVDLYDGETLVANAVPTPLHLAVPSPPSFEQAQAAAARYPGHERHPFPGCFVCGPARDEGDGLRIFPGPLGSGSDHVAAPWCCAETLADAEGFVRPEFICAALDCPGHWASAQEDYRSRNAGETEAAQDRVAVMAKFDCEVERALPAGEETIVMGWPLGRVRRHREAGAALFDSRGYLVARARTVWVDVPRDRFPEG